MLRLIRTIINALFAAKAAKDISGDLGSDDILPPIKPVENTKVEELINTILKHEGGYQDDPTDGGNWYRGKNLGTNYGITPATLSNYQGYPATRDQMLHLLEGTARSIYKTNYYSKPRINLLPTQMQPSVFDWAVNSGPKRAIMELQQTLNSLGGNLKQDGKIGKNTMESAHDVLEEVGFIEFINAYCDNRNAFYKGIVERRPEMKRWLTGWLRRSNSFRRA